MKWTIERMEARANLVEIMLGELDDDDCERAKELRLEMSILNASLMKAYDE